MSLSKRITIRVNENEIAVVGSVDMWQHLIETYEYLAKLFPEDEAQYDAAKMWIQESIQKVKNKTE